jgi:hypothetical protein
VQIRVLDVRREVPSAAVAERLGLAAGERVHRVERMRIVDGDPLAHESAALAGDLPDLRAEPERRGSLYATLREAYGIEVGEVEDEVQTRMADPAEAAHLDVETGHRCCWCTGWPASRAAGRSSGPAPCSAATGSASWPALAGDSEPRSGVPGGDHHRGHPIVVGRPSRRAARSRT